MLAVSWPNRKPPIVASSVSDQRNEVGTFASRADGTLPPEPGAFPVLVVAVMRRLLPILRISIVPAGSHQTPVYFDQLVRLRGVPGGSLLSEAATAVVREPHEEQASLAGRAVSTRRFLRRRRDQF